MGPGQGNGLGLHTLPTESTRHQTEYSTYVTNRLSYVNRRSLVRQQTISRTWPDNLSYVTRRSLVRHQTISRTRPDNLSYVTRRSLVRHQTISRTSPAVFLCVVEHQTHSGLQVASSLQNSTDDYQRAAGFLTSKNRVKT